MLGLMRKPIWSSPGRLRRPARKRQPRHSQALAPMLELIGPVSLGVAGCVFLKPPRSFWGLSFRRASLDEAPGDCPQNDAQIPPLPAEGVMLPSIRELSASVAQATLNTPSSFWRLLRASAPTSPPNARGTTKRKCWWPADGAQTPSLDLLTPHPRAEPRSIWGDGWAAPLSVLDRLAWLGLAQPHSVAQLPGVQR